MSRLNRQVCLIDQVNQVVHVHHSQMMEPTLLTDGRDFKIRKEKIMGDYSIVHLEPIPIDGLDYEFDHWVVVTFKNSKIIRSAAVNGDGIQYLKGTNESFAYQSEFNGMVCVVFKEVTRVDDVNVYGNAYQPAHVLLVGIFLFFQMVLFYYGFTFLVRGLWCNWYINNVVKYNIKINIIFTSWISFAICTNQAFFLCVYIMARYNDARCVLHMMISMIFFTLSSICGLYYTTEAIWEYSKDSLGPALQAIGINPSNGLAICPRT